MRDSNISERARCYGITITADGTSADGTPFHNSIAAVIEMLMAIVRHYARSRIDVRWRFQAERGKQTHRLHYQAFIDFGCAVKMKTALHWMPTGAHLEPVRDTPEDVRRAADYCIKDDTRCADDDEDLDLMAGPYSYGFDDDFDVDSKPRALDVCDDVADAIVLADDAGVDMAALRDALMTQVKAMTDAALHGIYTRTCACKDSYSCSEDDSEADGSDASGDDAIGFGTDYDELFEADADDASTEPEAIAGTAASTEADSDADWDGMTDAEKAAYFAPLFDGSEADSDDASTDASSISTEPEASSERDAIDLDGMTDAEKAAYFAPLFDGSESDGSDAISTEAEAIASSPASGTDASTDASSSEPEAEAIDGMTDDDFRLMAEAFARPQPDESQRYLETMLLGVKRRR